MVTEKQNIKILHINAYLTGGAAIACLRLHNSLIHIGLDSKILSFDNNIYGIEQLISYSDNKEFGIFSSFFKKIKFKFFKQYHRFRMKMEIKNFEMFTGPKSIHRIENHPLVKEADIIHLHWITNFIDIPRFFRKITDKPIIWTLHDMNPFTGGCHYSKECLKYTKKCIRCPQLHSDIITRRSTRNFYIKLRSLKNNRGLHIVGVSEWIKKVSETSKILHNKKHYVIGNSIDTELYKPLDNKRIKLNFGIDENKKTILLLTDSIKRINKGYDLFEKAIKDNIDPQKYKIIIVGYLSHLNKLDGYDVILFNYLKEVQKIRILYSLADVVILPSRYETFSQVTAEAMSCGKPVVAFDESGPSYLISHKVNGYLAKAYDTNDLADGIEWVLNDDNNYDDMSNSARKSIINNFSSDVIAEKYLKLYSEALHLDRNKFNYNNVLSNNSKSTFCDITDYKTSQINFGNRDFDKFKFYGWSQNSKLQDKFNYILKNLGIIIVSLPKNEVIQMLVQIKTKNLNKKVKIIIDGEFLGEWELITDDMWHVYKIDIILNNSYFDHNLITFKLENQNLQYENYPVCFNRIMFI
jgi:glycosyltransferase involved in cell wall biosynthesis